MRREDLFPERERPIVVEVGIVRIRPGQDVGIGRAALQAGRIQRHRDPVLPAKVDAHVDAVEMRIEEVEQPLDFLPRGQPAVAMLAAEHGDARSPEFGLGFPSEPRPERRHGRRVPDAERAAQRIAARLVHRIGGETGMVGRAGEAGIPDATRRQPLPVRGEKRLEGRGAGLFRPDLEDAASGHGCLRSTKRRWLVIIHSSRMARPNRRSSGSTR